MADFTNGTFTNFVNEGFSLGAVARIPFDVSDVLGILTDVQIGMYVTRNVPQVLNIFLYHPDGTMVQLFDGDSPNDDFYDGSDIGTAGTLCTFSESAAVSIEDGVPPFAGEFRPADTETGVNPPLSSLAGKDPNGRWWLVIQDHANATHLDGGFHTATLHLSLRPGRAPRVGNHWKMLPPPGTAYEVPLVLGTQYRLTTAFRMNKLPADLYGGSPGDFLLFGWRTTWNPHYEASGALYSIGGGAAVFMDPTGRLGLYSLFGGGFGPTITVEPNRTYKLQADVTWHGPGGGAHLILSVGDSPDHDEMYVLDDHDDSIDWGLSAGPLKVGIATPMLDSFFSPGQLQPGGYVDFSGFKFEQVGGAVLYEVDPGDPADRPKLVHPDWDDTMAGGDHYLFVPPISYAGDPLNTGALRIGTNMLPSPDLGEAQDDLVPWAK